MHVNMLSCLIHIVHFQYSMCIVGSAVVSAVCSVQCPEFSVHAAVCRVQCSVESLQCGADLQKVQQFSPMGIWG